MNFITAYIVIGAPIIIATKLLDAPMLIGILVAVGAAWLFTDKEKM